MTKIKQADKINEILKEVLDGVPMEIYNQGNEEVKIWQIKQAIQLSLNSNKEKCSEATCNNPASLCFECVAKEVKDGIRLGEQKASKDLLKHTADNINENIRQAKQELWDDLQNKALTDKEWFKIKKRHNLK